VARPRDIAEIAKSKGEGKERVAMMAWKDESFQMSQLCVCLALSVAASRETTPFGSLAY